MNLRLRAYRFGRLSPQSHFFHIEAWKDSSPGIGWHRPTPIFNNRIWYQCLLAWMSWKNCNYVSWIIYRVNNLEGRSYWLSLMLRWWIICSTGRKCSYCCNFVSLPNYVCKREFGVRWIQNRDILNHCKRKLGMNIWVFIMTRRGLDRWKLKRNRRQRQKQRMVLVRWRKMQ